MGAAVVLQQGVASGYAWPIVDATGQPADLTGWSAASQVRDQERHTGTLLHEFTAEVVDSTVTITWTAAESLAWTFSFGHFDVLLIDPDGVPRQIVAQGTVSVDRVVTESAAPDTPVPPLSELTVQGTIALVQGPKGDQGPPGPANLVIGPTEPPLSPGQSVLWLDTTDGDLTLNLVTGD